MAEIRMWNDISQGGIIDVNDRTNTRLDPLQTEKYLKRKSIPLDNSIGLGLGRQKLDMDSYNERIARFKNRYMDVTKMKRILIGLINNPNTGKGAREFYIADLKGLIDRNEL
jgi:hypothetical protein